MKQYDEEVAPMSVKSDDEIENHILNLMIFLKEIGDILSVSIIKDGIHVVIFPHKIRELDICEGKPQSIRELYNTGQLMAFYFSPGHYVIGRNDKTVLPELSLLIDMVYGFLSFDKSISDSLYYLMGSEAAKRHTYEMLEKVVIEAPASLG
ncbi:hypothetical protein [Acinetobacter sp.]|uniref:hypothetical protein n=1 Tax=Acinetobacter sp. TaxID=472 RepID=UPI003D0669DE